MAVKWQMHQKPCRLWEFKAWRCSWSCPRVCGMWPPCNHPWGLDIWNLDILAIFGCFLNLFGSGFCHLKRRERESRMIRFRFCFWLWFLFTAVQAVANELTISLADLDVIASELNFLKLWNGPSWAVIWPKIRSIWSLKTFSDSGMRHQIRKLEQMSEMLKIITVSKVPEHCCTRALLCRKGLTSDSWMPGCTLHQIHNQPNSWCAAPQFLRDSADL